MKNTPKLILRQDGVDYSWNGWFGCQLESFEWTRPPAGTTRKLFLPRASDSDSLPVDITIYTTRREGLKIHCTWAVSSCGTTKEHAQRINSLRERIKELL